MMVDCPVHGCFSATFQKEIKGGFISRQLEDCPICLFNALAKRGKVEWQ